MADETGDKPIDKDYARSKLAEMRRILSGKAPVQTAQPMEAEHSAVQISEPSEPYGGTVEELITAFEEAVQYDNNVEYWSARQLMSLLGYGDNWKNFERVVVKAQISCHQSGQVVGDHFSDVSKMVAIGSGAERSIKDVHVTRYGAYLIAQNGDSKKKQVAFAQTYFAVQTRRQELEDHISQPVLSEEQRRVMLRDEMSLHNKKLVSAAKQSGVQDPLDFAVFQNKGYEGLYGGLDRRGIQSAKGLPTKANILNHMGSTELAANLFRATQTEDKLRRERVQGKANANAAHYQVGRQVRKAIQDIGGTMPERLEAAEDIDKVRRRLSKSTPPEIE